MFGHIGVGVDGSPKGSKTVPVALSLAQKYGSAVTVVHVREIERYEGSDVDLGPPIPADALVEGTVKSFLDAGVEARGEVRRVRPGETPDKIIDVAKTSHADLIVMGTRGMTELKSLLLGGVAN